MRAWRTVPDRTHLRQRRGIQFCKTYAAAASSLRSERTFSQRAFRGRVPFGTARREVARSQSVMVPVALIVLALSLQALDSRPRGWSSSAQAPDHDAHSSAVQEAQRFFYNGDYDQSAALTQALCAARPDDLQACELRTASLHFQIKKALKDTAERDNTAAWNACAACPGLMSAFVAETARAQAFTRARLKLDPRDEQALFFLGKVDLNYVWLQ